MAPQPASNPFAAFRCCKVLARNGAIASAAGPPAAGKQLDSGCALADSEAQAQQVSPAQPRHRDVKQPAGRQAAGKRAPPAASKQTATAQRRKPALKRKASALGKAALALAAAAAAEQNPVAAAEQKQPVGVPELLGDAPLRLILVGHNPSDHAWKSTHYYSNPTNRMWRLLRETGIAPPQIRGAEDDRLMPAEAGVGFVDVGCGVPGTASNQFSSAIVGGWSTGFYVRLAKHLQRACDAIGCTCGECGAPAVVAFTGKRQFSELVNHGKKVSGGVLMNVAGTQGKAKITNIPLGPQKIRPEGWPLPLSTAVWVLTSTSGASPMTNADRKAPYQAVADVIASIPRARSPTCTAAASLADGDSRAADSRAAGSAATGQASGCKGTKDGSAAVEAAAGQVAGVQ